MYWQRINPERLAFHGNVPVVAKSQQKQITPVALTIHDLSIHVPIIPTEITNSNWPTTDKGVSYVTSSPVPGETGNSVIYGHNFKNILGDLPNAKPGQEVIVTFSNNSKKYFTVEYTAIVKPTQTDILKQSRDKRITVYTCTGFFDTQRFVVVAIEKEKTARID